MRILLLSILLLALSAAKAPAQADFDQLHLSNPTPTFDHGYVVGWDIKQLHSVTIYAPDGNEAFSLTSLKLADGTSTSTPLSVAVDTDGTSAMVYWAENGRRSGFALLDSAGHQLQVVETQPYKPAHVCFAPDHSIWMLGDQWPTADTIQPDFLVFRHYSRDGKLIGAYIPRSALPAWQGAGLDQLTAPFIGRWRMRAASDRIGAAMNLGGTRQLWVEVDFNGRLIGQWSFTDSLDSFLMPAAFDSRGVLYGDHGTENKLHDGIWILDKSTGVWKPAPSLRAGRLLGADDGRLVYWNGDHLQFTPDPTF